MANKKKIDNELDSPMVVLEAYDFIEKVFCESNLFSENSMKSEALMSVLEAVYRKGKESN